MFRQAFRRSVALRSSAVPSLRSQLSRRSVAQLTSPPALSAIPALRHHLHSLRFASTAAAPEEQQSEGDDGASGGLITEFSDLPKLGVHQVLVNSIRNNMKYDTMTEVQTKTINAALLGKDMVAQAKTGTGKTLAFLIPILQRMLQEDPRLAHMNDRKFARPDDIRGVILSPTRELAEQIAVEAKRLVQGTGLVVQLAVGGTRKNEMLYRTQREGCHLLVGTPGRLNDLLHDPHSGIAAPNLAALVLDEADRMLDVGFSAELESIMEKLPDPKVKARQTMLFSATIPRDVVDLARSMVRPDEFEFVQTIAPDDSVTPEKVSQHIVPVTNMSNLLPTLHELIDREVAKSRADPDAMPFKALIFHSTTASTQVGGMVAAEILKEERDIRVYTIHSKLTQPIRTRVSNSFRNAKSAVLISSDVTARGLDFPNVTHVIQIGAPPNREQYIHRLGRTGRQDKIGEGWLIVQPTALDHCRQILGGLPITVHRSLECASYKGDPSAPEAPEAFRNVRLAHDRLPRRVLAESYLSNFGQIKGSKQQVVDELNDLALRGWAWERPPYMTPNVVMKRGLQATRGLNTTHRDNFEEGDGPFGRSFGSIRDGQLRRHRGGGDRGGDSFGDDGFNRNSFSDRSNEGFGGRSNNRFGGRSNDGFGGRSSARFGNRSAGRSGGGRRDGGDWTRSSNENFGKSSF